MNIITKRINKRFVVKYIKYLLVLLIGACSIIGIFSVLYYNPNIQKHLEIRDDVIKKMSIQIDSLNVLNNSLLNESSKIACKVGYSSELRSNQLSLMENNRLNLKKGDRILVINEFGLNVISTECIVSKVENTYKSNSSADLFLSKDCIRFLTSQRKIQYEGVFNMYVRKIIVSYE